MAFACALIALSTLLVWWGLALDWTLGIRSMARLGSVEPPEPRAARAGRSAVVSSEFAPRGMVPAAAGVPSDVAVRLSVVVPARNEAAGLPEALASLLAQDLPCLEIIIVDDRSEDDSAQLALATGAGDPRLTVLRVRALPNGWLGKNHALAVGAERARGQWLLFTDADVRFAPGTLRLAVEFAEARHLDHLALLPRFEARTPLLHAFVTAFALLFTFHTRPWRASAARSSAAIGIGAFALVRRSAYDAIGGHTGLRMRVDDDLSLGRTLKGAGFRQEAVFGAHLVSVEWYRDVPSALQGLEKNAFAGLGFSVWRVTLVATALIVSNVLPFVLLPVTLVGAMVAVTSPAGAPLFTSVGPLSVSTLWIIAAVSNALIVTTVAVGYAVSAGRFGHRAYLAAWHPLAVLLLCFAVLRSAFVALRSGEVEWRGTRYRLSDLRGSDR